MIARVAVRGVAYSIDHTYDYAVPAAEEGSLLPGMRVAVPFGLTNRRTEAMVLETCGDTDASAGGRALKRIIMVLDDQPVLSGEMIRLALWLRERCFCTFYDVVGAMLPGGMNYLLSDRYFLADGVSEQAAEDAAQNDAERELLRMGTAENGFAIAQAADIPHAAAHLRSLEERGLLRRDLSAKRAVGDREVKVYSLAVDVSTARSYIEKNAARYNARCNILNCLIEHGEASAEEILYYTGEKPARIEGLVKSGLVCRESRMVYRRPEWPEQPVEPEGELNAEQSAAVDRLRELIDCGAARAVLLFGVTGSGKTRVYIAATEMLLERGRGVIVLVPEIALTPQLARVFRGRFGQRVAVLHSRLSDGERTDEWRRIRAGEADVVLGTRSAVFAPVRSLGGIIIDEEQEQSYRSDCSPNYHARDVARWRCAKGDGLLLVGSATPSVESFYAAQEGRYELIRLKTRFAERTLPSVEMADMCAELRHGNARSIGSLLAHRIEETLEAGEQAILLLNRRGAARMCVCVECGHTPGCPNCSMPLRYHSANGRLMCHYCGVSLPLEECCPECGGEYRLVGAGTQRCEEELHELFPSARVLRMDSDTTTRRHSHEEILGRFGAGEADILLGTQMVAKGLDFGRVTLVGIISADQALYAEDFRAHEQTFSLLTQAVGRAGRGERAGRAVVQSFVPQDPVLAAAARQDYEEFYRDEIRLRRALGLPPFREIVTLTCSDADEMRAYRAAMFERDLICECVQREGLDIQVLGPAQAPVYRVNRNYRMRLTLSCGGTRAERLAISSCIKRGREEKRFKGCNIFANME